MKLSDFFASILVCLGILQVPVVPFTPVEDSAFTDYDESAVSFDEIKIVPKAKGETYVTVNCFG